MRAFKTESKKLLDLMINSIYTNREIFLRELISNASDAMDKRALAGLTDASVALDADQLVISLETDTDARIVRVCDRGIGMTETELEENLGTIAHSGSEIFKLEHAQEQGNAIDIIGRFGVGFYAAFMVAERVRVYTRPAGSDACWLWESDGVSGYEISAVAPTEVGYKTECGTTVELFLKPDTDEATYEEFLHEHTLRELVVRYSNYVRYPIQMLVSKHRQTEKPADAPEDWQPTWESYQELDTLNSQTPLWKKKEQDISEEEAQEFYKTTFRDFAPFARSMSLHAEGSLEYDALLFIPSTQPFDLYSKDYEKGLQLYSSNVLIMEKCADLLPDYYNFVRGVVDSADINLNISRETLQQTRQLQAMARRIEKKITSELKSFLADDRSGYEQFFDQFGRGLKYGIYQSFGAKKDDLQDLLLFWSARKECMITLGEYRDALKEGQEGIYYVAGQDRDRLLHMPAVQLVLSKGYDVLLCSQDVDEFCFQAMGGIECAELHDDASCDCSEPCETCSCEHMKQLPFVNVLSSQLDLATDEEKTKAHDLEQDAQAVLDAMKATLEGKAAAVKISTRLTGADQAPAVLASAGDLSLEMERILAQNPEGMFAPKAERVLELNGSHAVFTKLKAAYDAHEEETLARYTELLYNQALLMEGQMPEDPVRFATQICELM